MERVIGIDLGTTNSCVAVFENGVPTVIPNRGGYKTTPSMIAIAESGKKLVGHTAKRQAVTNAENTVFAAKRLIGRKFNSPQVKNTIATSAYTIVEGPHGDARIQLRGKTYSVPEISAMILQEMKVIAEDYLGAPVSKAVITVPAYFNDNQRQATKDAGTIAGLEVMRIINEPTAAALAYGYNRASARTIAVYDLGGGTFDISVLEIGANGVFRVIATAGDTFLGGEDFDFRILNWLVDAFQQEHGIDLRQDRMALQRLKDAAEKSKCELSSTRETEINLPFITVNKKGETLHLQRTLTRDKFESLCTDLVDRTLDTCRRTLEEAKVQTSRIDDVVLVGGMTRVPKVIESVAKFFGREPSKNVHPDEVVALGASIQGAALLDQKTDMLLLDVTPHTLGLMTHGSHFEGLIPQNTPIPTSRSQIFTTSRDDQVAVKILVMQGESSNAEDNELLGEFMLTGLRKAPKGQVEIEVTFEINADGIVSVRAKDLETNQQQAIQVSASSGLTKDEIRQMMDLAKDEGLERKQHEELEGARQEMQRLIAEIEKMFPHVEAAVASSEFGRSTAEKARDVLQRAKVMLRNANLTALKEHNETLSRTARVFRGIVQRSQ